MIAAYDQHYYEGNQQLGDRPALRWYAQVCKQYVTPRPARMLDYGCGTGWLLRHVMAWAEVSGYEVNAFALEQARNNVPQANLYSDAHAIPKECFDGVVALHVLEHVPDPQATLQQLYTTLKPGGLLLFVVPAYNGLGHAIKKDRWFAFRDPTHISLLPEQEWERVTVAAGFQILKKAGDGLWDAPYLPLIPCIVQLPLFGWYAAIQVYLGRGRLFLPASVSECLIVLARK